MKNTTKLTTPSLLLSTLLLAVVPPSEAAVIVVDPTDSHAFTTTHLGTDNITIAFIPGGGGTPDRAAISLSGGGRIGVIAPETAFRNGSASLMPTIHLYTAVSYVEIGNSFINGAGTGLNYARLDLDHNSVYETVVEFDTRLGLGYVEDDLTRYAYDSTGASLDIPAAIAAMNGVPEPSTALLTAIGFLALVQRHRLKDQANTH